jgi:putative transposase
MEYKSNNNIVYSCKYRRKVLVGNIKARLKDLLKQMLLEADPQYGIHKAEKLIKGKTSRYLRKEFKSLTTKLPTLWTNSYFVSTVGGAPLSIIKQYIESQKTSERK